jgi:GT2 family glycosyltransferase
MIAAGDDQPLVPVGSDTSVMTLPVTIVIPSYGRGGLLARFLPTYLAQDCAEIVIVDDASPTSIEMEVRGQVRVEHERTRIVFVRNEKRTQQPHARMIGAHRASQPFIFFGEDDAYLAPGLVASLWRCVAAGDCDMCCGPWIMTRDVDSRERPSDTAATAEELVDTKLVGFRGPKQPTRPIRVPFLHSLALMRRDDVLEIGFDPGYVGNAFREETDFYVRAAAAGRRLAIVPAPAAYHYKGPLNVGGGQHGAHTLHQLAGYEWYVARNNLRFLRKNGAALELMGRRTRPAMDTCLYMLRRILGFCSAIARRTRSTTTRR